MGFRDEVEACVVARSGPTCSVALLKAAMSPGDAADLEDCLNDPAVPDSAVREALHKRSIDVKINTLGRHRRRQCSCPRPGDAEA